MAILDVYKWWDNEIESLRDTLELLKKMGLEDSTTHKDIKYLFDLRINDRKVIEHLIKKE